MKATDNKHLSCLIVFMVLINSQYGVVFASPGINAQPRQSQKHFINNPLNIQQKMLMPDFSQSI
jgi:hypothetical protein